MTLISYRKKNFFSSTTYIKDEDGDLAILYVPQGGTISCWTGNETISFLAIGNNTNSYRIFIAKRSIGYIHINFLRKGATINIVKGGSYQYEVQSLVKQQWVLRKDKLFIKGEKGDICIDSNTYKRDEIVIASSIFITERIGRDLSWIISVIIIAMLMVIM